MVLGWRLGGGVSAAVATMEDTFSQFGDTFGGHSGSGAGSVDGGGGHQVSRGSDLRIKVKLTPQGDR